MKIAIPTKGNTVDNHFGHCESYTIFSVSRDKKIEKIEVLPSPVGCGCKSNIATTLKEIGVNIMLAGNMGTGALNILRSSGIEVFRGCSGDVTELVQLFLTGKVDDSGETCQVQEHQCTH